MSLSIYASSKDLQLYVASRIPELGIRDTSLCSEILETLTNGAGGM